VTIFGYAGDFTYTPDSGCAPLAVHFRANTLNVPNIIWDFSDGHTSTASMIDTITHVYLVPGAYVPKLILSDNTGCQSSSPGIDTIKVDGIKMGFTTNPNPICLGETVNFVDTSSSYWSTVSSWNWSYNGTTSTLSSPSVTYTAVGTYPVTLTDMDGWGCTATYTSNVIVYEPPTITVSPDTIICLGDAATLYGYGGVSYTWAGAGVLSCTACNPTHASPTVVTQYTVTGKDAHGCTNTDTTSVILKTLTVSHAWGDTAICMGEFASLHDSGGSKYTWIPSEGLNNAFTADPLASPPNSIKYMAIAKLGSCLPDTNYVTVIMYPLPTVDAGPDQRLLAGSVAKLKATGNLIAQYLWTPGATLNCDTCYDPQASMSVTTTYVVKVATEHGCLNSDSVTIHLYCDNSQLFVPNSFTPNGDGENDVFYPRGKGVSEIKSFRIYNRWGEKMFERSGINLNDASNAWDGSYNGADPRPDVYVWVIDALCETGEPLFLKGDITIIR
jgi:gliding motility-associated-like protein